MLADGLGDTDDLQRQHGIAPHHDARPEIAHGVVLLMQPHGPAALRQRGAEGEPCEAGSRDLCVPGRRLWCCHRSTPLISQWSSASTQTVMLPRARVWKCRLKPSTTGVRPGSISRVATSTAWTMKT